MQRLDRSFIYSPSDLNDFLECEHLTSLEVGLARGELTRPDGANPQAELIRRKGEEHEDAHLAALEAAGRDVVRIELQDGWDAAARATEEALRSGADVIYQGVLHDPSGWPRLMASAYRSRLAS